MAGFLQSLGPHLMSFTSVGPLGDTFPPSMGTKVKRMVSVVNGWSAMLNKSRDPV